MNEDFRARRIKLLGIAAKMGYIDILFSEVRRRFYSKRMNYGLKRSLVSNFSPPKPLIDFHIRELTTRDLDPLLDISVKGMASEEVLERIKRILLFERGIPRCYVGITQENIPCFMGWMFTSDVNKAVQEYFNGGFPWLSKDEVLLEMIFIPENFRGKRLMPYALCEMVKKGREIGARSAVAFVVSSNIPSLKGFKRAGFKPYIIRRDSWLLFKRNVEFLPLDEERALVEYFNNII